MLARGAAGLRLSGGDSLFTGGGTQILAFRLLLALRLQQVRHHACGPNMPIATVRELCTPNALVTSDSLVEQVAQIEDFASRRIDGREFFRRNYFTDGLRRLVERGFERLAG